MLSVIIPAYNEESNIEATIQEIINSISGLTDDYEIIVVDDHSNDSTFDILNHLSNPKINCIRLSRRSGSHSALRAGLAASNGDAVLCISADGQDNPETIKEMLIKWQSGAQIVWALRKCRNDEPFYIKSFAVMFYRMLNSLTGNNDNNIDLSRADFYLLDRKVVNAINSCQESNTSLFGLIAWMGFKQDYAEYDRRERRSGKSKWSFRSRTKLAKDWIIAFSGLPLKMMTLIGLGISFIGFLYAIFIVFLSFTGNPIQGWSSLMIILLVIGGIQMSMLGVIGEYLWRNLDETRKRPLYFIEKSIKDEKIIYEYR